MDALLAMEMPSLIDFTCRTFPKYRAAEHHKAIAKALQDVSTGTMRRLIITMPPRHGKSELVSVRFPAWYLGQHPDNRIIHASYAASLSNSFSRQVRNLIRSDTYRAIFPGVSLADDSQAVDSWSIAGHRGGFVSVGVGGGITGKGAHVLLIDDPVKSAAEADSEIYRERTWEWYVRDAYPRLEDGGAIVLVQTRWHEDDLAGRLIAAERAGGEHWTVMHLPAISDDGAALWPEKYSLADLENIRTAIGSRAWEALYQGRPMPPGGNRFKRHWFQIVAAAPAQANRVRYWDKAATEDGGDYTAGVLMAQAEGVYYIEDVVHGQWSSGERDRIIRHVAESDRRKYAGSVAIRGEQEPGASGKDAALAFVQMLAGYNVATEPATGSKEVRADPLAAQVEAGNVKLVEAPWNTSFIDEMCHFPAGTHDDQVDAASGAFNRLAQRLQMAGDDIQALFRWY